MNLQSVIKKIDAERKQDDERYLLDRKRKASGIEFLNRWTWEWFCSMNLRSGCSHADAERFLKVWRIKLSTLQKIRIAYQGVFNLIPHPHVHLVALGTNKHGQTLYNISETIAKVYWYQITGQSARVEKIDSDLDRVHGYIADKNSPLESSEMLIPYNRKLLTKRRITNDFKEK